MRENVPFPSGISRSNWTSLIHTFLILLSLCFVFAIAGTMLCSAQGHSSIVIDGNDDLTPENGVTGGSGTAADPYVIEGWNISGPDYTCILINNTSRHIVLRNLILSHDGGASLGIELRHVSNCTVAYIVMQDVHLYGSDCARVSVQDVTSIGGRVELDLSESVEVVHFTYRPPGTGGSMDPVRVSQSGNVTVRDCDIVSPGSSCTGIEVLYSNRVDILDNTLQDVEHGISVSSYEEEVTAVRIEGNRVINTSIGISASNVLGLGMANNTITGVCNVYAMAFSGRDVWYIRGNTMETGGISVGTEHPEEVVWDFRDNLLAGLEILYFANATGRDLPTDTHELILANCSGCTVDGKARDDIFMTINSCSNITVGNCTFDGAYWALMGAGNDHIRIEDCDFRGCTYGIYMFRSSNVTTRRNSFSDFSNGITFPDCSWFRVTENAFTNGYSCTGHLYAYGRTSSHHRIDNNTIVDCKYGIMFYSFADTSIADNRMTNISQVGIGNPDVMSESWSSDVTIERNVITNASCGLLLYEMREAVITRNTVTLGRTGIQLQYSNGVRLSWNTIANCSDDGIDITWVENLLITANVVSDCQNLAVILRGPEGGARVILNDFINNKKDGTNQAFDGSMNRWDLNGWGNYWSDYSERYPNATNNGLVWSEPYDLGYLSKPSADNYPLVHRFDLEPPVADAGGNLTVDEGTHVTMDGSSSIDNREIVKYEWVLLYEDQLLTFSGLVVGCTLDIPGVYPVTLTVTDAFGNQGTDVAWITVLDVLPPTAEAGPPIYADQFTNVTLDGSGCRDTGTIVNYTWRVDLPDGTFLLYGKLPVLYCGDPGEFNVALRATDSAGHWAEDTTTLVVLDVVPPVVVLEGELVVNQGAMLRLDASRCTDNVGIEAYDWALTTDGGTVHLGGAVAAHAWDVPGEYRCGLLVRDAAGNEATAAFIVRVLDVEPPEVEEYAGLRVPLAASYKFPHIGATDNVGIADIAWTFVHGGEAVTLHGAEPSFTFGAVGTYDVTVTAFDAANNTASRVFRVVVYDPEMPVAEAGPDQVVDLGDPVTLDGLASVDNDGITRYRWTFEDGGEGRELKTAKATYIFVEVGAHVVTLTVWDTLDNTATDTMLITVRDDVPPVASIRLPRHAAVGSLVGLDGAGSTDNVAVVNWTWDFDHNGSAVELFGESVRFAFERPGTYIVRLTVRDAAGLEDEATMAIEVGKRQGETGSFWAVVVLALVIVVAAAGVAFGFRWLHRGRREGAEPGEAATAAGAWAPEVGTAPKGELLPEDGWVEDDSWR